MIQLKNPQQIKEMREAGRITGEALLVARENIREGISTLELDKIIRNYIEKAVDIVIQIDRLSDGKRKITSISEVVGMKNEKIVLKEIFAFKERGLSNQGNVRGEFVVYKYIPKVYDRMKRKGIILEDIFGE